MILTSDEKLFLWMLLLNFLVALVYLLGAIFLVGPRLAKKADDPKKELRGHRVTYWMRFLIMILCPILGPLYFLIGYLCYQLFFWEEANLGDVLFNKSKINIRLKADEERERNILPLEEAILVNETQDLRTVMLNVIREDFHNNLAAIKLALNSEDSETSHYAASILSTELNMFRAQVHKMWKQIQEETQQETACEVILLNSMNDILKQHVFVKEEQEEYVEIFERVAQSFYDKRPNEFKLEWYEKVCERTLEIERFDKCTQWCFRLIEHYPQELAAYTCQLKLYFAQQNKEQFFKTLEALKASNVIIDNETLELIRFFS